LIGFYLNNVRTLQKIDHLPESMITSHVMKNQLFLVYWLENSIFWWKTKMEDNYTEYMSSYRNTLIWILTVQSVVMLGLAIAIVL